jgi:hypothetical protein
MRRRGLFIDGFSARLDGCEALKTAVEAKTADPTALRKAATGLDEATPNFESLSTAVAYSAFAEALRLCALLVEWRAAVLEAAPDADRFLRAAQARRKLWLRETGEQPAAFDLVSRTAVIETLDGVEEIGELVASLAAAALPIGIVKTAHGPRIPSADRECDADEERRSAPKAELAVAFVKFALDGAAAAETHFLSPGEAHDVEIEVRVSRWPEAAAMLELQPLTIEQPGTYEFPTFQIAKPAGDPPYMIRQDGRAILKYGQGLHARPFEFRYSAHFAPGGAEQPVVVGQRTLRIDSVDLKQNSLTGYGRLDAKIVELRDTLRARPMMSQDELADALTALIPLANFAGRSLQDNLVREPWPETKFQTVIRDELRRSPTIGADLEEHAHAAGGITDLSFRGIRIELKVEASQRLTLEDCQTYLGQTASYVVGSGKRIGILCVLDCSPKREAPFPAEDGLGIFTLGTDGAPVCIVALLVQGNLARPSDLS